MKSFLQTLSGVVLGTLSGFDRLTFRGHLLRLMNPKNMKSYCGINAVLHKDFKAHARDRTDHLIAASLAEAKRLDRPIEYLRSSHVRKEDYARHIANRDGITDGLIGIFSALEPCWTYALRGNRETKRLELRMQTGKCLHLYHYYQHPTFGFLYARVQTWFPFSVQIGINGREWLGRQLTAAGLDYRRHDNCITWVEDSARAQQLLDGQLTVNWAALLDEVRTWVHPSHPTLLGQFAADYYWSLSQSEWATDVLFRDREALQSRYGNWLRFAMTSYASPDVLRFLGRKLKASGDIRADMKDEILGDLGRRVDGLRIKHRVAKNSIKMYDKAGGTVPRTETTINDPGAFLVDRPRASDPDGPMARQVLRKGVADIPRRAEVCQAANERYLEGLAAVEHKEPLKAVTAALGRRANEPGSSGGRKVRGLNLLSEEDASLAAVVGRPEFAVTGLRNRDVVAGLYPQPTAEASERRRRSSRVTRLLRLLRAHGVIEKVERSHKYLVSPRGREMITAVLAARNATTQELVALAI